MADPLQRNLYVGFFVSLICGSVVVFSQIIPEFLIYFLTGTAEEVANSKVLTRQELKCEILLLVSLNVSFLIILSSWVRAAGPRTRVDFLSDITWKKLIIATILVLNFGFIFH